MEAKRVGILLILGLGFNVILGDSEVSNTLDRLLSGYDKRVRPQFRFDPDVVHTTVVVHDIIPNDEDRTVTLSVTLTETWDDRRLEYEATFQEIAIKELYNRLWLPDTMFHGAREVRNTAGFSVMLRTTGSVSVVRRMVVTVKQKTYSGSFPLDSDICVVRIRSESYTEDQLKLNWTSNAVKWDREIELPGFTIERKQHSIVGVENLLGERYSELQFSFLIKHRNSALVLCLSGPLIFVLLSFASFWISHNALFGRYCYLVVLIIMQSTHAVVMFGRSGTGLNLVTSLDIWEGVCSIFLLGALIETLAISHLMAIEASPTSENGACVDRENEPSTPEKSTSRENDAMLCRLLGRIDIVSRIAFPAVFIAFTIIFWATRVVQ